MKKIPEVQEEKVKVGSRETFDFPKYLQKALGMEEYESHHAARGYVLGYPDAMLGGKKLNESHINSLIDSIVKKRLNQMLGDK